MTLVVMDWFLQKQIETIRTGLALAPFLNGANGILWQYKNNFTPTPGDQALTRFSRADYPGAAGIDLVGQFAAATRLESGHYATATPELQFPPHAGGPTQEIHGLYVTTTDGAVQRVLMAAKLQTPFVATPGKPSLRVVLRYDIWDARSLLQIFCP